MNKIESNITQLKFNEQIDHLLLWIESIESFRSVIY